MPPPEHSRRAIRLEKVLPTGWSLNMHLVPLGDDRLLVYSPTWLGPDTFARVESHGEPAIIVAPNHFHHLSLQRFRERYPKAVGVAHEGALPRLQAKGHAGVRPPSEAASLLPAGVDLVACEGTKSGELWLRVEEPTGTALVVGDAFFNVKRETTGLTGLVLRLLQTVPDLSVGSTWRWLQLSDRRRYVAWASALLRDVQPARLGMAHGEDAEGPDLQEGLVALMARRLRVAS